MIARPLAVALLLLVSLGGRASAQDCRDATGEPTTCPAPAPLDGATLVVPAMAAPPIAPPEPAPPPSEADEADELTIFGSYELFVDVLRPGALRFTQVGPERAPDLAREAALVGAPEIAAAGLSLSFGARPLPWLRLPELRLGLGGGDFAGAEASWGDGAQSMGATLQTLLVLRAEIGAGVEIPIDDFAIFAMGHVALAGYFVEARLEHPSAGSLGVQLLAEDAWEAGWTVGMAGRIGGGIRISAAYRHVHTGAEADQIRFAVEFDGR